MLIGGNASLLHLLFGEIYWVDPLLSFILSLSNTLIIFASDEALWTSIFSWNRLRASSLSKIVPMPLSLMIMKAPELFWLLEFDDGTWRDKSFHVCLNLYVLQGTLISSSLNSLRLLSRCEYKELSTSSFSMIFLPIFLGGLTRVQRTYCALAFTSLLTEVKLLLYSELDFSISTNFSAPSHFLPFWKISLALRTCKLIWCHRALSFSVARQSKSNQANISYTRTSFSFLSNSKINAKLALHLLLKSATKSLVQLLKSFHSMSLQVLCGRVSPIITIIF